MSIQLQSIPVNLDKETEDAMLKHLCDAIDKQALKIYKKMMEDEAARKAEADQIRSAIEAKHDEQPRKRL